MQLYKIKRIITKMRSEIKKKKKKTSVIIDAII